MTDKDVVERAATVFARRVFQSDRGTERGYKPVYLTALKGAAAAQLMQLLRPLMGHRRQTQIDRALAGPHSTVVRWRGERRCSSQGCGLPAKTKALCKKHYHAWWKARKRGRPSRHVPLDAPVLVPIGEPLAVPASDHPDAIAWLAGLLEGEGTFAVSRGYPTISAQMCDYDVLERAARIMDIRTVSQRDIERIQARGWSPSWGIALGAARGAEWMRALRPFMGRRRRNEIDRALAAYHPVRLTAPPQTCVVEHCANEHRSRGLCHKHYMKWDRDRKAGKPQRITPLR